jgi:PPM family protein phosphatase
VSALALSRFGDDPETVIRDDVAAARINLRHGVRDDPSRDGMATTLTVVVCDGERVLLGHVGDSRAYHYRDGRLDQISRDHTYVQTLVDSGLVSREEMAIHPWRNVVLRSLQASPEDELTDVDVLEVDVQPGDRLLLCSDGLTDMVDDDRIAEVLRLKDPHSAAAVLTHAALQGGGRDNITVVALDVVEGPQVVGDGLLLGAVYNFENIVDPASVRQS